MEKNWIDEMIEREAIPKAARQETVAEFCAEWGIDESTYYYQSRKDEHQKKSLKIALMFAKKRTPEILEKLAEKAELGNDKSVEMYLDYVLELSKNLDIKSDGKQVGGFNYIVPNDNNSTDNQTPPETAPSVGETTGQTD